MILIIQFIRNFNWVHILLTTNSNRIFKGRNLETTFSSVNKEKFFFLIVSRSHSSSHWSCVSCHHHREMAQQWYSISVRNSSSYWSREYDRVRHVKRRKNKTMIRYDTSDKSKGIFHADEGSPVLSSVQQQAVLSSVQQARLGEKARERRNNTTRTDN